MFITIEEIIAMIVITLSIGYIFSKYLKKPIEEGYDPIGHFSKRRNHVWENTKFAAMIAAPPVILHELAHKFVAMSFGTVATLKAPYVMYAIVIALRAVGFPFLFFIGGYVAHGPLPPLQSALVAIAGPLSNFMIWAICVLIVKKQLVNRKYFKIIVPMGRISMFLGAFNMIPLYGFDGYWFFKGLLAGIF